MNSNICPTHNQQITLICQYPRCQGSQGCQQCFRQNGSHQGHESKPLTQVIQGQNNQQPNQGTPLQAALSNFDQQFENGHSQFNQHLSFIKQYIKSQFSEWLEKQNQNCILQHAQGQNIELISKLFLNLQNQLQSFGPPPHQSMNQQTNRNNQVQIDLDFNKFLDKYQIPAFMRDQLEKFDFNKPEFENPNGSSLIEEDRPNSLIVGQKDQTGLFNGRVMILYKGAKSKIYLGYMKNNQRHGYGISVIDDFQYYLGEFYNNQEWGYGEVQMIKNDQHQNEKYTGYFAEGKRCGRGEQQVIDHNQSMINIPCVEYFENIKHGPQCSSQFQFEIYQNGQSYFDINSDKQLRNIEVSSNIKLGGSSFKQTNLKQSHDQNDIIQTETIYDQSNQQQNNYQPLYQQFISQPQAFQQYNQQGQQMQQPSMPMNFFPQGQKYYNQ